MTDEKKKEAQDTQGSSGQEERPQAEEEAVSQEQTTEQKREAEAPAAGETEESVTPKELNNHIALRRGRMIAAGVIAAVVLCAVAVVVAGIFQIGSQYLRPCPADLAENDPAPLLWADVIHKGDKVAQTGVPKKLRSEVRLKGLTGNKD